MTGARPDSRVTWALRTDRSFNGEPTAPQYFDDFDDATGDVMTKPTPCGCSRYASLGIARAWREAELCGRNGRWRVVRLTRRDDRK